MKRILVTVCIVGFLGACHDNTTGDNNGGSIDSSNIQPSDTIGTPPGNGSGQDSGTVIQKDSGYRVAKPTPADTGRQ